jgi:hypothetical protein
MNCRHFASRLSDYLDGDLSGAEAHAMDEHRGACEECATQARSLREGLDCLAELPQLVPRESVASRVLDRLEVERRGPGLALLFRPTRSARPLMLPSLVHAAFFLVAALGLGLALQRPPAGPTPWTRVGSEEFPELVRVPRVTSAALADGLLSEGAEGSLFFETRLARDGSVATVKLLQGDAAEAAPVIEALRRERFEPTRLRGQPVVVSVYRLISRLDVLAPRT